MPSRSERLGETDPGTEVGSSRSFTRGRMRASRRGAGARRGARRPAIRFCPRPSASAAASAIALVRTAMNAVTSTHRPTRPAMRRATGNDVAAHRAAFRRGVHARSGVRLDGARPAKARLPALERFFRWVLEVRTLPHGETWIAAGRSCGRGVDSAGRRGQLAVPHRRSAVDADDPAADRRLARLSRGAAMAGAMDEHPGEPCFYLAFIGVAPNRQGRGLGTRCSNARSRASTRPARRRVSGKFQPAQPQALSSALGFPRDAEVRRATRCAAAVRDVAARAATASRNLTSRIRRYGSSSMSQ